MRNRSRQVNGVVHWVAALAAAGLVAFLALAPATAAEDGVQMQRTRINSDRVIYSGGNETIVFQGSVRVRRSDFDLWCRRLTVHLSEKGLGKQGKGQATGRASDFEKIVAEEEVRLRMRDRNATCRKAVYRSGSEMITLLGDVRLQQGRNRVSGPKVRMDLARNTTEIVGSEGDQVEATFYTANSTGPSNGGSGGN
jgi:lipopolysaccharide export system protein LptA